MLQNSEYIPRSQLFSGCGSVRIAMEFMKKTIISIHNNQNIEIFVTGDKKKFEVWFVGVCNGRRVILDHHLTHDDLENCLAYAKKGDLQWLKALPEELPVEKSQLANEMEETINRGIYWDFEKSESGVWQHFGAITSIELDRKEFNAAKKRLLGRWSDGIVILDLQPTNKLGWECRDPNDLLNVGKQVHGYAPDWWNFAVWKLVLLNGEHKCGTHIHVLRVDEFELHLAGGKKECLARVLRKSQLID